MFKWFKRTPKLKVVRWCSSCSAEPAVTRIEVEIHDEWVEIDVGEQCLTRAKAAGML